MTPEQQADRWAKACIVKAENYKTGVLAARAKYADRLRARTTPPSGETSSAPRDAQSSVTKG